MRIVDRISGPARAARIGFLLHPEVEVVLEPGGASLTRGGRQAQFRSSLDAACEDAVWWPDMGRELATRRLLCDGAAGDARSHERIHLVMA